MTLQDYKGLAQWLREPFFDHRGGRNPVGTSPAAQRVTEPGTTPPEGWIAKGHETRPDPTLPHERRETRPHNTPGSGITEGHETPSGPLLAAQMVTEPGTAPPEGWIAKGREKPLRTTSQERDCEVYETQGGLTRSCERRKSFLVTPSEEDHKGNHYNLRRGIVEGTGPQSREAGSRMEGLGFES